MGKCWYSRIRPVTKETQANCLYCDHKSTTGTFKILFKIALYDIGSLSRRIAFFTFGDGVSNRGGLSNRLSQEGVI